MSSEFSCSPGSLEGSGELSCEDVTSDSSGEADGSVEMSSEGSEDSSSEASEEEPDSVSEDDGEKLSSEIVLSCLDNSEFSLFELSAEEEAGVLSGAQLANRVTKANSKQAVAAKHSFFIFLVFILRCPFLENKKSVLQRGSTPKKCSPHCCYTIRTSCRV